MSIFFNQDLFVGVVREHLVLDMAAIDPRYLMVVVKIHEDSNQIFWWFYGDFGGTLYGLVKNATNGNIDFNPKRRRRIFF